MHTQPVSEQILNRLLLAKFDEITELIKTMPEDMINTELPIPGSNSPVQILVHCCGMMRRWSSTVNLGTPVPRDRDAEFTIKFPKPEVLVLAEGVRHDFAEDLANTAMQKHPLAIPASRNPEHWMETCEGVLLHVYEELSQHLGHLEITRDILISTAHGPQHDEQPRD